MTSFYSEAMATVSKVRHGVRARVVSLIEDIEVHTYDADIGRSGARV